MFTFNVFDYFLLIWRSIKLPRLIIFMHDFITSTPMLDRILLSVCWLNNNNNLQDKLITENKGKTIQMKKTRRKGRMKRKGRKRGKGGGKGRRGEAGGGWIPSWK